MALFKISKGNSSNLPANKVDGYCYVTVDDHKFYVDYTKDDGTLDRFALNAVYADTAGIAQKLGSVDIGNSNKPIYLEGGTPKECVDFLPLTAGQDKKLTGPLGLTENVNYGASLPDNGFVGQLFFLEEEEEKKPSLPTGGTEGQVLVKNSSTDGDASWTTDIAGNAATATNADMLDGKHFSEIFTYSRTLGSQTQNQYNFNDYHVGVSRIIWGGYIANSPWSAGSNHYGTLLTMGDTQSYQAQIIVDNSEDSIYFRHFQDGTTWHSWYKLWKQGDAVTGAVWNDYAECRESDCEDFGYVLMETGDDSLTKTTERLSHFAGVSSDTWGFSQGETAHARTPIAVAGRVLVYPYQDRNNYKPGDCVCAAPGGTVDVMTREEVREWPDRIVGTVSCVPDYEEWGGGEMADRDPVKVNGRIWIKVM